MPKREHRQRVRSARRRARRARTLIRKALFDKLATLFSNRDFAAAIKNTLETD